LRPVVGLAVNTGKTMYKKVGSHRGMLQNEHFTIGSNSYEKMETFKTFKILFSRK
jgi:hypothetical protein